MLTRQCRDIDNVILESDRQFYPCWIVTDRLTPMFTVNTVLTYDPMVVYDSNRPAYFMLYGK